MKRERIVFLGPAPPFRGGISTFAAIFAKELSDHGHEVKMLNFIKQYPRLIFPGKAQIDSGMENYNLNYEASFTPYLPLTWKNAVKHINEFGTTVLIVSFWIPLIAPAFGWICRHVNPTIKVVYLIHNIDFHEKWPFARWFTKYAIKSGSYYLTLSQKTVDDLQKLIPDIDRSAILNGFHPVYSNYCPESSCPLYEGQCTILFFGLIKPYKGLDILLTAFSGVLERIPNAKLVIAGEVYGDDKIYREMIAMIDSPNAIEANLRYISDFEISPYFQQSNVCVIPYKSATQSGVVAIAFAHNLPVIASDVGGLSETVEDGKTGLLVPANDANALCNALIRYFEQNLQPAMRENIIEAKKEHSWEAFVHILEQIL